MGVVQDFLKKKAGPAEQYQKIITDLLDDHTHYGYAEDTLVGILDFVELNGAITEKQIQAVENIKNHPGHSRYGN